MNVRDWEFWLYIMIFVFACFSLWLAMRERISVSFFSRFIRELWIRPLDFKFVCHYCMVAERELLFDPRNLIHNSKKRRRR